MPNDLQLNNNKHKYRHLKVTDKKYDKQIILDRYLKTIMNKNIFTFFQKCHEIHKKYKSVHNYLLLHYKFLHQTRVHEMLL